MDILKGLQSLASKAQKHYTGEYDALLAEYESLLQKVISISSHTIAYQALDLTNMVSPKHTEEPWGFYYGAEQISPIDLSRKAFYRPLIHPFASSVVNGFMQEELHGFELLNFAARAVLSYPLGQSHVYMMDADVSGSFNQLSPILTSLDEVDNPKNFFHYLTTSKDQRKVLDILEELINKNITSYLSSFSSLQDYNKAHAYMPVPYSFVFINDIVRVYSESELSRLSRMIYRGNATKAGVYIFFSYKRSELEEHELHPSRLAISLRQLVSESCPLQQGRGTQLEPRLSTSAVQALLSYVQGAKIKSQIMEFKTQIEQVLQSGHLWQRLPQGYDYTYISVPIGFASHNDIKEVHFPSNAVPHSPHMFISGKTGSGKTILLHNIILNAALRFSPELLRFYLVDMKSGVSLLPYQNLPHAEVVSASSDKLYAYTVLERALDANDERGATFKRLGVTNIAAANTLLASQGKPLIPMILVIIDEFQDLVNGTDSISQKAYKAIEQIHKKGRSQGVFIGLCTQSLGGVQTNISQVGVKLSLITSAKDSMALLGNDAAVSLRGKGRAILNTSEDGDRKYNEEFQVAYIDETQDLPRYIDRIKAIYQAQGGKTLPSLVFNENDMRSPLSASPLANAQSMVKQMHRIYLGMPKFCREEHSYFSFHRDSKSNVVVIGNDRVEAMRLIGSIALQFTQLYLNSLVLISDMQNPSAPTYSSLDALSGHKQIRLTREAQFEQVLDALYEQLQARKASYAESHHAPECLYVLSDLRLNAALRVKGSFSAFAPTGSNSGPTAKEKLMELIDQGPELGVHLLIYSYSINNLMDVDDQIASKHAEVKIGLRGGDSMKLIAGFGTGEAVESNGQAKLIVPAEMGLSYAEGDIFIPYNDVGHMPNLTNIAQWSSLFTIHHG